MHFSVETMAVYMTKSRIHFLTVLKVCSSACLVVISDQGKIFRSADTATKREFRLGAIGASNWMNREAEWAAIASSALSLDTKAA